MVSIKNDWELSACGLNCTKCDIYIASHGDEDLLKELLICYGYGWVLYEGGYKGHGGATPGYSSNMFFKNWLGSTVGVFLTFNSGSALIYDEALLNNYMPTINKLLLDESEHRFQQTLPI